MTSPTLISSNSTPSVDVPATPSSSATVIDPVSLYASTVLTVLIIPTVLNNVTAKIINFLIIFLLLSF